MRTLLANHHEFPLKAQSIFPRCEHISTTPPPTVYRMTKRTCSTIHTHTHISFTAVSRTGGVCKFSRISPSTSVPEEHHNNKPEYVWHRFHPVIRAVRSADIVRLASLWRIANCTVAQISHHCSVKDAFQSVRTSTFSFPRTRASVIDRRKVGVRVWVGAFCVASADISAKTRNHNDGPHECVPAVPDELPDWRRADAAAAVRGRRQVLQGTAHRDDAGARHQSGVRSARSESAARTHRY